MEILFSSTEFLRIRIIFYHMLWPNCEGILNTRKGLRHIPSGYLNFEVLTEMLFGKLGLDSYLLFEGNLQIFKVTLLPHARLLQRKCGNTGRCSSWVYLKMASIPRLYVICKRTLFKFASTVISSLLLTGKFVPCMVNNSSLSDSTWICSSYGCRYTSSWAVLILKSFP